MSDAAARAALLVAAMGCGAAGAQELATLAQAMDMISTMLPKAIAANPAYLTKADGASTKWFTDAVDFASGADGAVTVTMREHYVQTRAGKDVKAQHVASFSMADVTVKPEVEPGDFTPSGAPAAGLTFACKHPGCVAAWWSEAASHADSTDLYIQDAPTRDRLVAAFRRLQAP